MRRLAFFFALLLIACEGKNDHPVPPPDERTLGKGFFVLNEGQMGANNSTLDFFDYDSNSLITNIFEARNPDETMGLGDTGNDLALHDGHLFAVMNGSGLVQVVEAETVELEATIPLRNPRDIAFKGGFAYVTSWGEATFDQGNHLGTVTKIDLGTMLIVGQCEVGFQPDGLAVVGEQLYVCNSGSCVAPMYDDRVSVIDLATFTEVKKFRVAPNLRTLVDAGNGKLVAVPWMATNLYMIDTQQDTVIELPITGSSVAVKSGAIYSLGVFYDPANGYAATISYSLFSEGAVRGSFITDGTDSQIVTPYAVAIEPESSEIFVTDAAGFVADGRVHCYSPAGRLLWSITVGVAPAKIVFN